jgi:hypothetical protein
MRSGRLVSSILIVAFAVAGLLVSPVNAAGERSIAPREQADFSAWFREIERGERNVLASGVEGGVAMVQRCSTPSLSPALRQAFDQKVTLWREIFPELEQRKRTIPVAFHVIHKGSEGNLTDGDLQAQIAELNRGFKKFDATFEIVTIKRKKKGAWYKKCQKQGPFTKMTTQMAVNPAETLNIYTCRPGGGVLGFAVPPGVIPENHPWNAVVLHWGTLPNGPLVPYDLGATATHEVGHYFGLFHTFENGCTAPGDSVADTPFEASPAFGCQVGRDTCPQNGADPVRNYMDYSDDRCFTGFSKGQRKLMNEALPLLRPNLGD